MGSQRDMDSDSSMPAFFLFVPGPWLPRLNLRRLCPDVRRQQTDDEPALGRRSFFGSGGGGAGGGRSGGTPVGGDV